MMKSRFSALFSLVVCLFVLGACSDKDSGGGGGGDKDPDPEPDNADTLPTEDPDYRYHGNDRGNGGDVVICFETPEDAERTVEEANATEINPFSRPATWDKVTNVSMLDLVEYTLPTGLPPVRKELMAVDRSYLEVLPELLTKLKEKSKFGDAIEAELEAIPLSNWKKAGGVVEIDDSNHPFFLPTQCVLAQVAVRQDGFVFYDGFIFDRMSERNKLALVLHEVIYSISGDSSSEDTRKAVGLVLSADEWDDADGLEIHRKLLPIGSFAFPYTVSGTETWISIDDSRRPSEFAFDRPVSFHWAGLHLDATSAHSGSLERFLAGDFAYLTGAVSAPFTTTSGKLDFIDGRPATFQQGEDRTPLAVGRHQVTHRATVDLQDRYVFRGEISTTASTAFGTIRLSDPLRFSEELVLNSGRIDAVVDTPFRSVCFKGLARFDAAGALAFVSEVSLHDFSCEDSSSDRNEWIEVEGVKIYINRSQFWFYSDGKIQKIAKTITTNLIPVKIESELFAFHGVEEVEFDREQQVRKVVLGNFGTFRHQTATGNEFQERRGETIELDEAGNPI